MTCPRLGWWEGGSDRFSGADRRQGERGGPVCVGPGGRMGLPSPQDAPPDAMRIEVVLADDQTEDPLEVAQRALLTV